jgi:exonuclease SbcC
LYLSLTHFLGQSASQRFSVKQPEDQWEALKGPAGVDRIQFISQRLGGHAARLAFGRRARQAAAELEEAQSVLAGYRGLREQLQRVNSLARAGDGLAHDDVVRLCAQVLEVLQPVREQTDNELSLIESTEALLERMREVVAGARESSQNALAAAAAFENVAAAYEQIAVELRDLSALIESTRGTRDAEVEALSTCREAIRTTGEAIETAQLKVRDARVLLIALEGVVEASASFAEASARETEVQRELGATAAQIDALEASYARYAESLADVVARQAEQERTARVAAQWRALADAANDIRARGARLRDDVSAITDAQTAEALERRSETLAERVNALRADVDQHRRELAERGRREEALSALVKQVRGLLRHDDASCPVCATAFAPGDLLQRAEELTPTAKVSTRGAGDDLADAVAELTRTEVQLEGVRQQIVRLGVLERERRDVAEREGVLLATASALDGTTIATLDDVIRRTEEYRALVAASEPEGFSEAAAQGLREEMERCEAERSGAVERLTALRSEAARNVATVNRSRGVLSKHPDLWAESSGLAELHGVRRSETAVALNAASDELARLASQQEELESEESKRRARVAEFERTIDVAEQRKGALGDRSLDLLDQWNDGGLGSEPSLAAAWRLRTRAEERALRIAEAENLLVRAVDGYSVWSENEQRRRIEASLETILQSANAGSPAELESLLESTVARARAAVEQVGRTRSVAIGLADELQQKADEYARSVLEPLSRTIQGYSRALLTQAEQSLFYSARFVSNRSELRAGVLRTDENGNPVVVNINPNLYFSEGQLSALSVSSLLAASTSFRWSCWPALLMDDPLQHNDVIHASAFIDLMRSLVQKLDYQVVMSAHDADEADFIERKCASAGIAFQMCELRPPGRKGLVSV